MKLSTGTTDLLPLSTLQTVAGYGDLEPSTRKLVESETRNLNDAMIGWGKSRLAIGEHLMKIQDQLEPHRLFSRFLDAYNLKRSTAYNNILGFKNASSVLSPSVLEFVAAKGVNMIGIDESKPLGIYTSAVKKLPPPSNPNAIEMNDWLKKVEAVRRKSRAAKAETPVDTEILLREAYRYVSSRLEKVPSRGRSRRAWIDKLIGMILTEVGISSEQRFEPEAIPGEFRPGPVGRPKAA